MTTRTDRLIAGGVKALFLLLTFLLLGSMSVSLDGQKQPSGSTLAASGALAANTAPIPEPLLFEPLDMDQARLLNQGVPFAFTPGPVARPFAFAGSTVSRDRAIDCLAAAMWYEAGNDEVGQLSVGQVVLNRVRHPAFPKTVCGVVFQGSERRTGCQFTFTCDGALARRANPTGFARAENRALAMLYGMTYAPVGLATHYHTDWVHPVWSAEMDKLAKVGTHLFFRWHGAWGQPSAMRGAYAAEEPTVSPLAFLSPAHGAEAGTDFASAFGDLVALIPAEDAAATAGVALTSASYSLPKPVAVKEVVGPLNVNLPSGEGDGTAQALGAMGRCGTRSVCKLIGHVDGDRGRIAFLYVRDRRERIERAYWDCEIFPRTNRADCLSPDAQAWVDYNPARP